MKFLPEFGACWGGATITPPPLARTADDLQQPETAAGNQNRAATRHESRRQLRSINATNVVNWKPKLNDICEEKVLSDSDLDGRIHGAPQMAKKSSAKIKPSSMTIKVSMLGEGFRKSYRIAMNAFVPSPYMI